MKELIKKWWFWLIILIIVFIIGFITLMCMAFDTIKGEDFELAKDIQSICPDATVYSSTGGNTLIIEFPSWDNDKNEETLSEIYNCVKTRQDNGELQGFKKLITLTTMDTNLFIKTVVNLESFIAEKHETYILFEEYQNLYDDYSESMELLENLID